MTPDLVDVVTGIVHEPTQIEGPGLDLTLSDVYTITEPARVDFGGGELTAADREPVTATRRHPDDDYGWYDLDAGQYLVAFNESLEADDPDTYRLQTRDVVREAGAFHPTLSVSEISPVPLSVGDAGIRLKENARISTLFSR